jgi:hypothetical protein
MKNGRFLIEGARNDTANPDNAGGFQYFQKKDNEGSDGRIG